MTDEQIQTAVEVTRKLIDVREGMTDVCRVIDLILEGDQRVSVESLRTALRDLIPAIDAIRIPL